MTQHNPATCDEIATQSEANSDLVESNSDEARAAAHEARVRKEMDTQFARLKDESRTIYGRTTTASSEA